MQRIIQNTFNRFLLIAAWLFFAGLARSQNTDSVITELKTIHRYVSSNDRMAISNRGMNIFLADKTGYLSASTDLSYYTNYFTANSSTGKITINHNFQKANGIDEPIKKLFSAGIAVTLPVSFSNGFLDNRFDNRIGFLVNYKWLGKVKTSFTGTNQKKAMDALRTAQLYVLETEITDKIAAFEKSLDHIVSTDIPGQNLAEAKQLMMDDFFARLKEMYEEKFAALQAESLTATNNYKTISTQWTSFNSYIPIISPGYFVAGSFTSPFRHKHSYPLQLQLNHTLFWQNSKTGKIFVSIGVSAILNNSKLSYGLTKIDLPTYKLAGGADTLHTKQLINNKAFIGDYKTYITPAAEATIGYYPGNSHIGVSATIQQNLGEYKSLNGKFSMPVVIINSKKTPAVTFDFYVLFIDLTNKIKSTATLPSKTVVGISAGIPFSRLMY